MTMYPILNKQNPNFIKKSGGRTGVKWGRVAVKVLGLFLLSRWGVLEAELEDWLKESLCSEGVHRIRNVDYIYMINLDQRPEKFESSAQELSPYGIFPYRFSAVNGWELPLEAFKDLGIVCTEEMLGQGLGSSYLLEDRGVPLHDIFSMVGRTYFAHHMSRGAIGIVLSHLSILQDALKAGHETIWVMEDDVEVIQDPHVISDLIDKLDNLVGKDGWDILFTDRDTKDANGKYIPCTAYAWRPNFTPSHPEKFLENWEVSPEFRQIGARYGAYSMIIRKSGMEKIMKFFKDYQIFLPYDIEYPQVPGIQMYTVVNDVVSTQPRALSDNGGPNYKKQ